MLAECGKTYADTITGFRGVCIAKCYWLNGCVKVGLQGDAYTYEGTTKVPDPQWFDEQHVEQRPNTTGQVIKSFAALVLERDIATLRVDELGLAKQTGALSGGPAPNPPRA